MGRAGMPFSAKYCFASLTECCPKWKMLAARTASAFPCSRTSTMCCKFPAPPLAMTGMPTASLTAAVSSMSYPSFVPSASMLVSRISPAPLL